MAISRRWNSCEAVARKCHDLAERRRNHFIELSQSGRWDLYYNEAQFLTEMRKAEEFLTEMRKAADAADRLAKVISRSHERKLED